MTGGHDGKRKLASMTDRELLELSTACVEELRERGVVRTGNAPLDDYAEWLAAKAFSGELAPNAERSFDLTTGAGVRVQVKSRRVSNPPRPGQLQTSTFRSWGFDQALLMLVDERTYEVRRASLIPQPVVEELSRYVAHVNGSNAYMTEDLMGHAEAVDMTGLLQAAAGDAPTSDGTEPRRTPRRSAPLRAQPVRSASAPPMREQPTATPPASSAEPKLDWIWLTDGAIDDFRQWRIEGGATYASAQSYTSGAKRFVRFCRSEEVRPTEASVAAFHSSMLRKAELSPGSISDYRSHARKFVEFLETTRAIARRARLE